MTAAEELFATPMSTPAPTPTKPAPTPPAIVIVFILSSAEMLTSRPLHTVPARVACVVTFSSVTPTGTATPTKPAPSETTIPKMSSLEDGLDRSAAEGREPEAAVADGAVRNAAETVGCVGVRGDEARGLDGRLGVLGEHEDVDADTDTDEAACGPTGDARDLRGVLRQERDVVAGRDRHACRRSSPRSACRER